MKDIKVETAFSNIDCVIQCLLDSERTTAFKKAINKIVKNNESVIELGTGSGILSMFAAKDAKSVLAIEYDETVYNFCKNNIQNSKHKSKITVLLGDARTVTLKNKDQFDVVIMEMLTTAMVDEHQVTACNNLHEKQIVHSKTIFIPCIQITTIQLTNFNFTFYNETIKNVLHLWNDFYDINNIEKVSDKVTLSEIEFNKYQKSCFNKTLLIPITKSGIINSILLQSTTLLTKEILLNDTKTINAPVIFPVNEFKVKKGDTIELIIKYIFGGGWENFEVIISKSE